MLQRLCSNPEELEDLTRRPYARPEQQQPEKLRANWRRPSHTTSVFQDLEAARIRSALSTASSRVIAAAASGANRRRPLSSKEQRTWSPAQPARRNSTPLLHNGKKGLTECTASPPGIPSAAISATRQARIAWLVKQGFTSHVVYRPFVLVFASQLLCLEDTGLPRV